MSFFTLVFSLKFWPLRNGNPPQYSCLENPVDRGVWWAAVQGVTQSQTRLKRLSSSSSGSTIAHQASLSMEFSRQEYWNGLSFPTPGDLPWSRDQTHISCVSYIGRLFLTTESPGKPTLYNITTQIPLPVNYEFIDHQGFKIATFSVSIEKAKTENTFNNIILLAYGEYCKHS